MLKLRTLWSVQLSSHAQRVVEGAWVLDTETWVEILVLVLNVYELGQGHTA